MTTNLMFTIDERNNVLKVPNAALRFTPQDANIERQAMASVDVRGAQMERMDNVVADGLPRARRQQCGGQCCRTEQGAVRRAARQQLCSAECACSAGSNQIVWVMGQDGKPQRRRITVGLSDGTGTEVVDGNLQEGEFVITGQNVTSENERRARKRRLVLAAHRE